MVYKPNLTLCQKNMIKKEKRSKRTIMAIKESQEDEMTEAIMLAEFDRKMTPKFKAWSALYMDKSNKKYWGNATKCALKTYNTTNIASAARIGHDNTRKLKIFIGTILEAERMGFGEMVKIGAAKMLKGSFQDWKDLMIMAGYYDPKYKPDASINIGTIYNIINLSADIAKARRERGLEPLGEVKKSPP